MRAPASAKVSSSPWRPPPEFDDYVVVQALGSGSNGTVWLAEDTVLARHVAVKFLAAPEPDAAERQRFVVEARAAARVQHPNVVCIYRAGALEDRPFLVTEFVRGRSLEALPKPLSSDDAVRIAVDLARGLAAAHRKGVLHCDLKPANAVVGEDGVAKLLDFGLAQFVQRADAGGEIDRASSGGITGTPAYLAPEIWRGEPHSRRSDVYALGAVLHELATGQPPFAGVPVADLPRVTQEREPVPWVSGGSGVEAQLAAVAIRCLRRDPAERFASGDDIREALEAILRPPVASALGGNPYRGLRAFQSDHRALFFGRSAETGIVVDRVRTDATVLVTGDSGVGKSSLCRAGVLPAIAEGALRDGRRWRVQTLVPGRRPLTALCAAVAQVLGGGAAALEAEARADARALARALGRHLSRDEGVVLFVDQLEELLTVGEPGEAEVADAALAQLGASVPGIRLLGTVRADFLARFSRLRHLAEDLARVLYFLRPLAPDRLHDVIVGPARATGLRFEDERLVETLVEATAAAEGGLPLLQFALAELWERRDVATGTITHAALREAGGVAGALARHADGVVAALAPPQRAKARRMLLRLVTLDGLRARRTGEELGADGDDARAALDALVRGRLVVAQDAEQGNAYEIAHEALVGGWGTLSQWLHAEAERRAVREALAYGAQEWSRQSRSREALLGEHQLREVEALEAEDLTTLEVALLDASRGDVRRRKLRRAVALGGIPVVAVAIWLAASAAARSDAARKVEAQERLGLSRLDQARSAAEAWRTARTDALRRFESLDVSAEDAWKRVRSASATADAEYRAASSALEAAVALDPARETLRAELADALLERALLADAAGRAGERDELVQRLALYDTDGSRRRRWLEPARVDVSVQPDGAELQLLPASGDAAPAALGRAPVGSSTVAAGAWIVEARAAGRAPARLAFVASRGEHVRLAFTLPRASAVPDGFVYVPAGTFLFGSAASEEVRAFHGAQPLHASRTGAFLVSRHETTYGEWIAWLESLPSSERALRTPRVDAGAGAPGLVRLRQLAPGRWRLELRPGSTPLAASSGEPLVYPGRGAAGSVDWAKLPVSGVSAEDAEAYVAWLASTGRVPGARLCSEVEWERAARGADSRPYPGGDDLAPGDANHDATHGAAGIGPDPVGSHARSRSPYGIDDAAGNVWEVTRALEPGEYVARGGSYWHDLKTAQIPNRERITPALRDPTVGIRVCASLDE
ncbi:MAG TPA: protein kinase [Anaeromyxobacteraceae bacterium]|nr:protein kinase [Anaeromyxobacteraceae bacterium]